MWTRRIVNLFGRRKRKPRFETPGLALALAVLLLAVLLAFLARSVSHRDSPPRLPEPSGADEPPIPTSVELPEEAPPTPPPAETEYGCPDGCDVPPPDCDIKGNISRKTGERIYHLPGQQYYGRTVISPGEGEAWFCTEAEARANGWRKAKV